MRQPDSKAALDFSAHLPLIASAATAFAIVVRLLAVSGYDTETAAVVLQNQGTGSILFGTLLPIVAFVPMIVVAGLLAYYSKRPDTLGRLWQIMGLVIALMIASALFVPWPSAVGLALAVALGWATGRRRARRSRESRKSPIESDSGASRNLGLAFVVLALTVASSLLITAPWLPAERISYQGNSTVGYVLGERDEQYVVLVHSPRSIQVVPRDSERSYCSLGGTSSSGKFRRALGWFGRQESPLGLLTANERPERCPDPPSNNK